MKRCIILIFCIFVFPVIVNANSINSIDMDIYIDDNGNANITEIWDATLDNGTEGYHPFYNLGEAYISNISVKMDGRDFNTVDNWNIDYSFDMKKYKAGLYYAGDGEYDVCFGISAYGTHKYIIRYKINNFIVKLNDADMLYWNLFPKNFNTSPDNINITVYSNFYYSDSLDVWGYGKYGALAYVSDGKIHMKAEGINGNEYLTLLVKYPSETFNTSYNINKKFDYYLKMANKDAVNYNKFGNKFLKIIEFIVSFILRFPIMFMFIFITIFYLLLYKTSKKTKHTQGGGSYQNNRCDFGETGNIVKEDILPYRDIPTEDIFRAYWIIYNYNLGIKDEDILGALLLKWVNDGYVKIEKESKDETVKIDDITNIVFAENPSNISDLERKIYSYFYQASIGDVDNLKVDNKLTKDEFSNWCKVNINRIINWFSDMLDSEVNELVKEKKVRIERVPFLKSYDLKYIVDSSMMIEAEKVAGLKKFLEEFSIINEREPLEVEIFDKYLIYATMFGIADKVYEKFKDLYPDFIGKLNIDYVNMKYISDTVSESIIYAKPSELHSSSSEDNAMNYDGGGGGFSSGGGGAGSFGDGIGGGGFR